MVRIKHRYLLLNLLYPSSSPPPATPNTPLALSFNAPTPDSLTPAILLRLLRETISDLFGDYGAAAVASSLVVKYLSCPTSTAIVRVARAHFRLLWAACAAITHLPVKNERDSGVVGRGLEVVIRVVRVSGTIRKVEEEVIRRGREAILKARRLGKEDYLSTFGNAERIHGRNGVVDEDGSEDDEDDYMDGVDSD